jgi:hypothetical protein
VIPGSDPQDERLTKAAAIAAAHRESRANERGYCFAVERPDRTWYISTRKPLLRTHAMHVVCCEDGREELA